MGEQIKGPTVKTKIGIVYFCEELPEYRAHHSVNDKLIETWCRFYKRSNTKMKPYLLMDEATKVPACWPYDVVRVADPEPTFRFDVLNKVGWIKAQGYQELGRCVILDLDCLLLQSIDYLDELDAAMAMPYDPSERKYKEWPEIKVELNAGVVLQNSPLILDRFKELWEEKKERFSNITYYDELIFSAMCYEFDGVVLDASYNGSWTALDNEALQKVANDPATKILHFHGNRKKQLPFYLKDKILLC